MYWVKLSFLLVIMSLADAKAARKVSKTKVTKLGNKITNLLIEGDKSAEISVLVTQFKTAFAEFSKTHEDVAKLDPDSEVSHDVYYDQAETNYFKILSRVKESKPVEIKSSSVDSTVVGLLSLPKLELEVFTGEVLKYPTFIKSFKASVESCTTDADIRLSRLFQFLGGEARESVRSCLYIGGNDGYKAAISALDKLYGSPHRITQDIIKSLRSPKPAKSCKDLRQLANELRGAYQILNSEKCLDEIDSQVILFDIVSRLAMHIQNRWYKAEMKNKKEHGKYLKFKDLVEFVESVSDELSDPIIGEGARLARLNRVKQVASYDVQVDPPSEPSVHSDVENVSTSDFFSAQSSLEYDMSANVAAAATSSVHRPPSARGSSSETQRQFPPCALCKGSHFIGKCNAFRRMSVRDRLGVVQDRNLCHNCLRGNHTTSECQNKNRCFVCGLKHTSYIHFDSAATSYAIDAGSCLMPIVRVKINDSLYVNVGLDNFSSSTFITRDLADRLRLPGKNVQYTLKTMHGVTQTISKQVKFSLKSLDGQESVNMSEVKVVDSIPILSTSVDIDSFPHLRGLGIPSDIYSKGVDILVGHDHTECLIPLEIRRGDDLSSPVAIRYLLGWVIQGFLPRTHHVNSVVICNFVSACASDEFHHSEVHNTGFPVVNKYRIDHSETSHGPLEVSPVLPVVAREDSPTCSDALSCASVEGLDLGSPRDSQSSIVSDINRLWEIENGSFTDNALSVDDKRVLELWDNTCKLIDGHYMLPIPWKSPEESIPNNFSLALNRLDNLVKRLTKVDMLVRYDQEIRKLIDSKYAEVIPSHALYDTDRIYYLPHHGVINPNKPGKLRVVFDCSAKYAGRSLNERCLQGPDLVNKLQFVLMRFRLHQYGILADVKEMYNQILVPVYDRDALRFLWYQDGKLVHMCMRVNVFGGIWCSSSSTYALRRIVIDNPTIDPLLKKSILDAMYVDDLSQAVRCLHDIHKVVFDLPKVLRLGGFEILKFAVNHEQIMEQIPLADRAKEIHDFSDGSQCRALGIRWMVKDDVFCFHFKDHEISKLTRRVMLSLLASVFDPLGLISPWIVAGKLILQITTRNQLEWDDPVSDVISHKWHTWYDSFVAGVKNANFCRCVKPTEFDTGYHELHIFCDASEVAFGAAAYLRCVSVKGQISSHLLMSKAHIAPIKNSLSIPRLELQAAKCAVNLYLVIRREIGMHITPAFFWTDSQIVLGYIHNVTRRFHTFVENRVSFIRSNTDPADWHHIDSASNPADLLTRPRTFDHQGVVDFWRYGPKFLRSFAAFWNKDCELYSVSKDDPEVKVLNSQTEVSESDSPGVKFQCAAYACHDDDTVSWLDRVCNYHGSWSKILKSIAWLRRFACFKAKRGYQQGSITLHEIESAQDILIKHVQRKCYTKEVHSLLSGQSLSKSSSIVSLNPFLDKNGILRVGGRTGEHPILIPHSSVIAERIVYDFHNEAHLGLEWTLSLVRATFWITKARRCVRNVLNRCIVCRKLYAKPTSQVMADLHPARINPNMPAFLHVGLDCFGPYHTSFYRGQRKRYGCIFTCMSSRAVHIEMLHSLDADSFLNALRRFIARRGRVDTIYCDNGGNFVKAEYELLKAFKFHSRNTLRRFAVSKSIRFVFTVPRTPHWGGNWERLIGVIKRVFRAVLPHASRLTDEVLQTTFCEIEAIVNSRPLTRVSDDPNDFAAISPSSLLTSKIYPDLPPGGATVSDMYRHRFKYSQHLADMFWSKWLKLYLPSLTPRSKWRVPQINVKVGELVLLAEKGMPRKLWPLAIVKQVFPGRDGKVRSVLLKTSVNELRRSAHSLVRLEADI